MPFTLTHTLAVLPIHRVTARYLPLSALIIGSIIPDFPLFFSLGINYEQTHCTVGILTWCNGLGLIAYIVFQQYLKAPWLALCPRFVRERLGQYSAPVPIRSFKTLSLVSLAIIIGSSTHVIWDSYTHFGGWGVRQHPALSQLWQINNLSIPLYKFLQYGSSIIGLPFLTLWTLLKLSRLPVVNVSLPVLSDKLRHYVALIFVVASAGLSLQIIHDYLRLDDTGQHLELLAYRLITGNGAFTIGVLVSYGIVVSLRQRLSSEKSSLRVS